jgi:alkylation response protein AidB-like acyl-CoA dehydrogenase
MFPELRSIKREEKMTSPLVGSGPEELRSFQELAERFAKKELEPKALDLDYYPYTPFNQDALQSASGIGLLHLTVSESCGGSGQGMAALSVILSRLAQADASFAAVLFLQALAQAAIARWAKQEVAEKYLKPGDGGPPRLFAFPVYAPPSDIPLDIKAGKKDSGSEEPGGYVLEGKFPYLALAPVAEFMIIPAEVQGSGRASFFIFQKDAPGLKVSEPVISLGLHNCPVADVELQGVKAGPENLLGGEGQAGDEYPELCAHFGGPLASLSLGVLVGSYQAAVSFAKERYQGGKQIIDHGQVRVMLANMAVLIEVAEAACMTACRAADAGRDPGMGFAAGIFVTDATTRATTDGVQCLGGYGYMHDYGQEKRMRDAKQIQAMFGPALLKRLEFFQARLKKD